MFEPDEFKQPARFTSIGASQVTQKQLLKGLFKLSLLSYGNQITQIENFQEKAVRQYRWITTSQMNEIRNLCESLPGPTLYQIVITITTLKFQSPTAGFLAFVVFNIPSWFMLFIWGTVANYYIEDYNSTQMKLAFLGMNAAAAGVMVKSLMDYYQQNVKNISTVMITLFSAIIFVVYRSPQSIAFCLIAGTIFSLYLKIQSKSQMSERSKHLFKNLNNHWIMGKISIWIFIIIYLILWIVSSFYPSSIFGYSFIFTFCGTFVIGPAAVIFSYLYAYVSELNVATDSQIWIGFPLSYLIPGSVVNCSLYYGVLIDGFLGLIVAAVFLYLPCFTSLFGMLPEWKYYRGKPGIQRVTQGLTCVSTGLLVGLMIISLQHWAAVDLSSTVTIFVVSAFFNYVWGFYTFAIIILGGFLANVRRWGLIYYRLQPDHYY